MTIEAHLENMKQALFSEMEKSKATVFGGLVDSVTYNRIPESLFMNYFLPCFTGNQPNNPNWVVEWISVAGTPMAEVTVFDDATRQDLFNVPGILHTNNLFTAATQGGLSNVFSRFEQINSNLPSSGMAYLFGALGEKNAEILQHNNLDAVKERWRAILQRYNLLPTHTAAAPTENAVGGLNDFLYF